MRARLDTSALPVAPAPALDDDQQSVVDHREGPLLVLAGPGTGKTATIVESVVARLEEGEDPDSILVLTFGRRAAGELRDRIAARLGGGIVPTVATFHSFAYSLLRETATAEEYRDPPRLLSGAEEDQRIRELIRGTVADDSIQWPTTLREALGTHGFASEVRALIARIRERDITPDQLRRLAQQHERPEWAAVAEIAEQEEGVMVLENVMDYSELMRRAVIRVAQPDVRATMRERIRFIYVDEFQDTDPLQVSLLRELAGPRCALVVVGDPDQAIYAFRGADVHGILGFRDTFRQANGEPAPIVELRTVRRYGPQIFAAARAALAPASLPGLPLEAQRRHRDPHFARIAPTEARVRVLVCPSVASRDAHVAEQIRAAHVHERVPWSDMAVLVRTAADLTGVERALTVAGVPAAISADEIPLHAEPAVAHVLAVVQAAAEPERVGAEQAHDLLVGPIGRVDVSDLRRLGRALRASRRAESLPMLPARELVRAVVVGEEPMPGSIDPTSDLAAGVARVRGVLTSVAAQIDAGAPTSEVLWTAWTGGSAPHRWPDRLRAAALAGSSSANHDLDSVIALFATAERLSERYRGVYGVTTFLATLRDQAIPAEAISVNAAATPRGGAVRIMTVHRAKGLEWSRVWVAGLEEGQWPNLAPRGSLLGVEDIGIDESVDPGSRVGELVREERNLLYVACTRARDELTVLAVDSGESGDDRPSRFIDDLTMAGFLPQVVEALPDVIASWPALVADLRTALADDAAPDHVREQAASLLAALADLRDPSGVSVVPAADPDAWWGIRALSSGPRPLRDPGEPIALSGSSLDALRQCSMKWFLDHEVHAETPRSSATAFGSIVHAIADYVARGEVPEDVPAMDALIDEIWGHLDFEAAWRSAGERAEARRALERFLRYHRADLRTLVETERYLETIVSVPTPVGGSEEVRIRGFIDRIEKDSDARLVAVDLKTSSTAPTKNEVSEHGQLGLYQVLLREEWPEAIDVGGAALVQLRTDTGVQDPSPKEQVQAALPSGDQTTWIDIALGEAAHLVRSEFIAARVGKQCEHCAFVDICPARTSQVSVIDLHDPGAASHTDVGFEASE